MKLTIGMAMYLDFEGVWMTLQALRLYHDCTNIELIVVDNKPDSPASRSVKQLIDGWISGKGNAGAKYIPMKEPVGTSAPRNEIFKHASGDFVMCVDSHVIFPAGVIGRLFYWLKQHPDCMDLLSGPMVLNDLAQVHTHFADEWRSEMWGTWATDARGVDPDGPPFEIPGMGLGMFLCRRDAWLGFNEHFRGFGGEEMYIHEKYRRAGRRNLCLPFLRWVHRFGRSGGVPYPLTRWNKVRNYVLGHAELGLDLKPVHDHFVGGKPKLMSDYQWDYLIENPVEHLNPPLAHGPGTELKKILASININPRPDCGCNGKTNQMDIWGVVGCRENRPTILAWMNEGWEKWGWKETLSAAARATTSGLAAELIGRYGVFNPLDPFPVLIDEAIRRAEIEEKRRPSGAAGPAGGAGLQAQGMAVA